MALLFTVVANRFLIYLDADQIQKDIQYEELSKSWGEERIAGSRARGPYYHPQKLSRPATVIRDRDMFKTPLQRTLKPGWGEHDRAVVDPDATIVPISQDWEPSSATDGDDDDDPFYEKYDHPPSLPQGSEPEEYLLFFGFPPPPLLARNRNNPPPRAPSPSDFGEPLI